MPLRKTDALPYFGLLRDITNNCHPYSIVMSAKTAALVRGSSPWTAQIFNGTAIKIDDRLRRGCVSLSIDLLDEKYRETQEPRFKHERYSLVAGRFPKPASPTPSSQ